MGNTEFILYQPPTNDQALIFRRDLLLVTQVALLGEIASSVRAITVGWTDTEIQIRALFDGPIAENDKESFECVSSEIVASFPACRVEVESIRHDMPASLKPFILDAWVYLRKER